MESRFRVEMKNGKYRDMKLENISDMKDLTTASKSRRSLFHIAFQR